MRGSIVAAVQLAAALVLAGCSASSAPPPVPAPISETIPKPPVSPTALIWQPGHWDWNVSAYVWVPGQYVAAEGHGNHWIPGFWENTDSGGVWHPAHWT
jgi:hypothetical protein